MSHTEGPGDNVDHEAHMRDVMNDVRDMQHEIKRLRAERDEARAALQLMLSDYRTEGCADPTCHLCAASKAAEEYAKAAIAKVS